MSLKRRFFLWGIGVVFLSAFLGVKWHLFLSKMHLPEFWEIAFTLIPFLLLLMVPLWVAMEHWMFRRLERVSLSNKEVGKGNLAAGFIAEESAKNDEIGELIESRNTMLSLIDRHQQEIEQGKAKAEQLQRQMQSEQEKLHTVIGHLPSGVLLLDAEKRLLLTNSAAEKFLSLLNLQQENEKVVSIGGMPIDDLLQPRQGVPLEVCIVKPEKKTFILESYSFVSEKKDQGWVVVLRDVSIEREQLQLAQKQDRLAAVGQLAAGIAHDFNNILTGIIGTAQVLLMEEGLSAEMRQEIKEVEKLGQRAAKLIRQVLDFSRKRVREVHVFDLVPFLKEMVKLWQRTLPESIQVSAFFEMERFPVRGNLEQIEQVMMNLAINARDAMPKGGKLSVRVRSSSKRDRTLFFKGPLESKEEWGLIEISDTGIGINEEVQKHIFEPFFTTKKRGEGTGLGLAQAYGIVKQHGGLIHCKSAAGRGTSFFIHLPLSESKSVEIEQAEKSVVRGKGETILLVEDEPQTRKTLQKMLEDIGYQVLAAQDGEAGLKLFQEKVEAIDGVLTDIVMPKMGGEALIVELRKRDAALPIVALSGYPLKEEEGNQGLHLKEVMVLQKPPALEELSHTLRRVIQSSQKKKEK